MADAQADDTAALLALLLALPGASAREQSIYEQDYDYLWYLLENEYPHYYVAERLRDRDMDEIKAAIRRAAAGGGDDAGVLRAHHCCPA